MNGAIEAHNGARHYTPYYHRFAAIVVVENC